MKKRILLLVAGTVVSTFVVLAVKAASTATNSAAAVATVTNATAAEMATNATDTAAIKITLKCVHVDSEETSGSDDKGANAVDGDPNTNWHTQWQDANPEPPHEIIIELTPASTIKGFTYLPRQDDSENGTIKGYEFYVSNDGKDFGQPVAKGSFENNKDKKTVSFAPVKCGFVKLKALSEVNGGAWTSAAEIGVVQ
jgi:alpha-glucosidase